MERDTQDGRIEIYLREMRFDEPHDVRGRRTIVDLFRRTRCGIYVLRFANGDFYAGQTRDVTRRFIAHKQRRPDVSSLSFLPTPVNELNRLEREVIRGLEALGARLANITIVDLPQLETDLDAVVPRDVQERWVEGDGASAGSERPELVDLRRRYEDRFRKWIARNSCDELSAFLHSYGALVLLEPAATEVAFWTVSCLNQRRETIRLLARVNVGWQEVMTLYFGPDQHYATLQAARSPLVAQFGQRLHQLRVRYPFVEIGPNQYSAGGEDQVRLLVPVAKARPFMTAPSILPALRLQVLRLMRKGPTPYGRTHCPQIADLMLGPSAQQENETEFVSRKVQAIESAG